MITGEHRTCVSPVRNTYFVVCSIFAKRAAHQLPPFTCGDGAVQNRGAGTVGSPANLASGVIGKGLHRVGHDTSCEQHRPLGSSSKSEIQCHFFRYESARGQVGRFTCLSLRDFELSNWTEETRFPKIGGKVS